jgi:hypothetical protein
MVDSCGHGSEPPVLVLAERSWLLKKDFVELRQSSFKDVVFQR